MIVSYKLRCSRRKISDGLLFSVSIVTICIPDARIVSPTVTKIDRNTICCVKQLYVSPILNIDF